MEKGLGWGVNSPVSAVAEGCVLSPSPHWPFQIHCNSFAELSLLAWPHFPHALPRVSQHSRPPLLRGVCLFRPHFRLGSFPDLSLLVDSRKVMML